VNEHEFWLIVISVPIVWGGEKVLDWLLEMWRLRNEPMTMAQVRRHHRLRFGAAAVAFAYLAIVTLVWLVGVFHAPTSSAIDYAATIAAAAATIYLWRIVRRRWRRMHER